METRSAYRTTSLARLVTLSSAQVQYIYCAALTCAVNKLIPGVFPAWETLQPDCARPILFESQSISLSDHWSCAVSRAMPFDFFLAIVPQTIRHLHRTKGACLFFRSYVLPDGRFSLEMKLFQTELLVHALIALILS